MMKDKLLYYGAWLGIALLWFEGIAAGADLALGLVSTAPPFIIGLYVLLVVFAAASVPLIIRSHRRQSLK